MKMRLQVECNEFSRGDTIFDTAPIWPRVAEYEIRGIRYDHNAQERCYPLNVRQAI